MNRAIAENHRTTPVNQPLNRWMDACCCFFLSAGAAAALYRLLPSESVFSWAFWGLPALWALLFALWGRRLRQALAFAALLLFLGGKEYWSYWQAGFRGFLRWLGTGLPAAGELATAYYFGLCLLIALAVTLFFWLLIRLTRSLWLAMACCASLIVSLHLLGIEDHVRALCFMCLGLIPLAASAMAWRSGRKNKQKNAVTGMAAAIAFPVTAVCLAAVFLLVPQNTEGWQYQPLVEGVENLKKNLAEKYHLFLNRNEGLASFDLSPAYGANLGGPVTPNDTRMLHVETDTPQLMRATTYDYYTGKSWLKAQYTIPRSLRSIDVDITVPSRNALPFREATAKELAQSFGTLPEPQSNHPLAPFVKRVDTTVTLLRPHETRLFFYGCVDDFSSEDGIIPYIEKEAEIKSLQPLANGNSYSFSSLVLDRNTPGFSEMMAEVLADENRTIPKDNYLTPSERIQLTQLPYSLVLDESYLPILYLAKDIVSEGLAEGQERNTYEKAIRLENWLRTNFTYTLTPVTPPKRDFVAHSMDTREGYCVYYATTMVAMARMLNIPARYVTGYALQPVRWGEGYEATAATAHAWAELHFQGVGWVPFDATGRFDFTPRNLGDSSLTDRTFFGPLAGVGDTTSKANDWLWLIPAVALILGAALIKLFLHYDRRAYHLPHLLKKNLPAATILNRYYDGIARQTLFLSWPRQTAETVLAFTARLAVHAPHQAAHLQQLGNAVSALRYGGKTPSPEDLHAASEIYRYFDSILYKKLKRRTYYTYFFQR